MRALALLALIAGLLGPAAPGFAAPPPPAQPQQMHAAMHCNGEHPAPARHAPGVSDCCLANVCAMNLALPALPTTIVVPMLPDLSDYHLSTLLPPAGIDAAPIPHPPKSRA